MIITNDGHGCHGNTSGYIRAKNLEELYQEFTKSDLQLKPPAVREWGMKELYVYDPHGNLLKFGTPTES